MPNRRAFLKAASLAICGSSLCGRPNRLAAGETNGSRSPKIGIRAASIKMVGTIDVLKVASTIPGIRGVELQATAGKPNLRDADLVRKYKQEAERCGLEIPSLAGIWDRGVKIHSPNAIDSLVATIRAAEVLSSGVILAAFFRGDAPDMSREESYGPIVETLKKAARIAQDAGVVVGLENSLSPADNCKLVDLVDHPAVGVYYDLHNMDHYGHGAEAIPGIELLGKKRICMVHVKNGNNLIGEPGPIDWPAAFSALNDIGYEGWYIYETGHDSTEDCIEDTKKNNQYLRRYIG